MKVWIAFLLLALSASAAEKPASLAEPVDRILVENAEPDLTELAYVGIRGAALYTELVAYFEQGARNEEDKKIVQQSKAKAVKFYAVGTALSLKTGKSAENIEKQMKMLLSFYSEEMTNGKLLNNNALTEFVQADLKAANKVFPLIEALQQEGQKK